LALERWAGARTDNGIASGLASWPDSARITWLALRTLRAVITVPIAEELACRGFLIRRVISRDFELLSPRSFTFLSVLVFSVAFGLLQPLACRYRGGVALCGRLPATRQNRRCRSRARHDQCLTCRVGSHPRRLVHVVSTGLRRPPKAAEDTASGSIRSRANMPRWSPDGKRLAFASGSAWDMTRL